VYHEKSCGAVVFRGKGRIRYLLLKYSAGHWDFVKGQIEENESEKDTVLRELQEETGIINAKFIGDFRKTINYSFKSRGRTIYKEVVYFLIHDNNNTEVKLSREHVAYQWLNYEQAMRRVTFQNAKNVLSEAHNFLKTKR
jgi:8-oxo-dGTP pyrophosphatase MutT (NUDIX family)